MSRYTSTILKVAIHTTEDNPVFGETSTHISIEDEGGGTFVVIEQGHDDIKPGQVRLDPDELDLIVKTAKMLMAQERQGPQ